MYWSQTTAKCQPQLRGDLLFGIQNQGFDALLCIKERRDLSQLAVGLYWPGLSGRDPKEEESLSPYQKTAERKGSPLSNPLSAKLCVVWPHITAQLKS